MSIKEWQELYNSIEIIPADGMPYAELPNSKTLDEFESSYNIKLPVAYREFIQVFGPGSELGQEFHVYAPGFTTCDRLKRNADLGTFQDFTASLSTDSISLKYHEGYNEQIARIFFFAASGAGEIIGWDVDDVRDEEKYEYGIYILVRGRRKPDLLANSFKEFIEDCCFSDGYSNLFENPEPWDEEEFGSQRTFYPAANYPDKNE